MYIKIKNIILYYIVLNIVQFNRLSNNNNNKSWSSPDFHLARAQPHLGDRTPKRDRKIIIITIITWTAGRWCRSSGVGVRTCIVDAAPPRRPSLLLPRTIVVVTSAAAQPVPETRAQAHRQFLAGTLTVLSCGASARV